MKKVRIRDRRKGKFNLPKALIFTLIGIGVLLMQTGFASLNTNLTVSGEAKITPPTSSAGGL